MVFAVVMVLVLLVVKPQVIDKHLGVNIGLCDGEGAICGDGCYGGIVGVGVVGDCVGGVV